MNTVLKPLAEGAAETLEYCSTKPKGTAVGASQEQGLNRDSEKGQAKRASEHETHPTELNDVSSG
jgi:hypothetical protein